MYLAVLESWRLYARSTCGKQVAQSEPGNAIVADPLSKLTLKGCGGVPTKSVAK
jgi:hypothetical protein